MTVFEIAYGMFGLLVAAFGIRVLRVMLSRGMRRSAILSGVLLVLAGVVPVLESLLTGRKSNMVWGIAVGFTCCLSIGVVAIVSGVRGRLSERAG